MPNRVQQTRSDEVAENSAFVRLLETKARVKMLDVLLRHSYVSLSQSEIAERAGVNQSTVSRNVGVFDDLGVIEVSDGHPTTYRVDRESSLVQSLQTAQTTLLEYTGRLHENDVEQLEDRLEWQPMPDDLRDECLSGSPTSEEQSSEASRPESVATTA